MCVCVYVCLCVCVSVCLCRARACVGVCVYICIFTELAPKLTATASVAQSVERWSRDPGSRVQSPAGGLAVAFFATGPGWVLKNVYLSDTRIYLTLKHLFVEQRV